MSAPARTYFCKNGHVAANYCHGEHPCGDELPENCPVCGYKGKFYCQLEWGDKDYDQLVPTASIRNEIIETNAQVTIRNYNGDLVEGFLIRSVPVYDISKLFNYL